MTRGKPVLAMVVLALTAAAIAEGGEFPSQSRAYCDNGPLPDTYWGAREVRGDVNHVVAGHDSATRRVVVENSGTDRHGMPFSSITSCTRAADNWRIFEAKLGLKADTLKLSGLPGPTQTTTARIVAEADLGPGADRAQGHAGKDRYDGGSGADRLTTFQGKDLLEGGSGPDRLNSGAGNDLLLAADGARDRLRCGAGRDRAIVDSKDIVAGDCERVREV